MTRESVTLSRQVTACGYDGITLARSTEIIEVVIEWPVEKPVEGYSYCDVGPWTVAKRLDKTEAAA